MSTWRSRLKRALSALKTDTSTHPDRDLDASLTEMLGAIGPLMLASGSSSVNEVDETLRSLASAYGRADLRVVALPTFVLVEDPATATGGTSVFSTTGVAALRLDQIAELQTLIRDTLQSSPDPDAVVAEVHRIADTPPRFGFWWSLLGHLLLTIGFGLVMNPTPSSLPVYAVLGVVVGAISLLGSKLRTLALILPVLAAFIATAIAWYASEHFTQDNTLLLVAPSLISFLPGLMLTLAAVELTNGQIIAGASRLLYGFARLAMLAFGVYLGVVVFGADTAAVGATERLGAFAPWLGLFVVAAGFYLYSAAPRRSLLWIFVAIVAAYGGQIIGQGLLGAELSGLIGALVAIPVVSLLSRIPTAPAPSVMLLCAYWVLVPGSLGFIAMSQVVSGAAEAGDMLIQTLGAILAIGLGMVIGAGFTRDTGEFARALRADRSEATNGRLN